MLLNTELNVEYQKARKGDVKHTKDSIKKAKNILQYKPKININKGLKKEIIFLKNKISLYK